MRAATPLAADDEVEEEEEDGKRITPRNGSGVSKQQSPAPAKRAEVRVAAVMPHVHERRLRL
jgi:hypothetical protein